MRRVASDSQIKDVLINSLKNSTKNLSELHRIVNEKLKPYSVSISRLKLIALKTKEVKIKIKKKILKNKKVKACPVCGYEFEKKYGIDVFGKKNHIGYICKKCNFSTGLILQVPRKYSFSKK